MTNRTLAISIATVIILFLLPGIGIIFMWIFAPWRRLVKAILTVIFLVPVALGIASIYLPTLVQIFPH